MKAYVIKNKEGKYYQSSYCQPNFTDNLFFASKYLYKEETKRVLNKSFTLTDELEPVEITIAEGDLEKENKVLRKALKLAVRDIDDNIYWWLPEDYIQQAEQEMKGEKDE